MGGKVYALGDIMGGPLKLSLKVRPERGDELRAAHAAIVSGHHLNRRHWITLTLDGSLPDTLVGELLASSHALVVAGLIRTPTERC
ncbi:MmcQ/YjbR family DNA-binding protein [Deinococcus saxicola]|uniref:MmcQ/YjbR family DNA-binding protein n=1 Tax=Deinococcus saxicola TaxID=249406 RepID=UPI0039F03B5C